MPVNPENLAEPAEAWLRASSRSASLPHCYEGSWQSRCPYRWCGRSSATRSTPDTWRGTGAPPKTAAPRQGQPGRGMGRLRQPNPPELDSIETFLTAQNVAALRRRCRADAVPGTPNRHHQTKRVYRLPSCPRTPVMGRTISHVNAHDRVFERFRLRPNDVPGVRSYFPESNDLARQGERRHQ
jgi:hypothetical protein